MVIAKVQDGYQCRAAGTANYYCHCVGAERTVDKIANSASSCSSQCGSLSFANHYEFGISYYSCPDGSISDTTPCYKRTSTTTCPSGYNNIQPRYVCPSGSTEISGSDYCY